MPPREPEDNAYAKFWGDRHRALWYVMVFSGVVNWEIISYPDLLSTKPKARSGQIRDCLSGMYR